MLLAISVFRQLLLCGLIRTCSNRHQTLHYLFEQSGGFQRGHDEIRPQERRRANRNSNVAKTSGISVSITSSSMVSDNAETQVLGAQRVLK